MLTLLWLTAFALEKVGQSQRALQPKKPVQRVVKSKIAEIFLRVFIV